MSKNITTLFPQKKTVTCIHLVQQVLPRIAIRETVVPGIGSAGHWLVVDADDPRNNPASEVHKK